nr:lytic transglycosylase domain-containing protein [uncultured Brevundimonas sp.]
MELTVAATLALATQCAPTIAPSTMLSIVSVESRFDPLAIGVNGRPRLTVTASSPSEAVTKASALIATGRSVDLGLAQINSGNLDWLGLTVADAFDPCINLSAAARVLQDGYRRSDAASVGEQSALLTALSYYNTGHPRRGFANGYVARVTTAAARFTPMWAEGGPDTPDKRPAIMAALAPTAEPPLPRPPAWDVFGQTEPGRGFVIRVSARIPGDPQ